MGFRARPGRPRSGGRRYASRNKEVQIPRRWHRRCCRAPQNHRPDQLGSRSALVTPWARVVSDWGHQGLCLRVLGAHFGHIFAHILHASPVVQIPPVGGPPRRSADKTTEPPPVVRKKNLQVASSTRAANARNKPVVQVIRTVKRVRNFRSCIWRSQMPSKMSTRRARIRAPK